MIMRIHHIRAAARRIVKGYGIIVASLLTSVPGGLVAGKASPLSNPSHRSLNHFLFH